MAMTCLANKQLTVQTLIHTVCICNSTYICKNPEKFGLTPSKFALLSCIFIGDAVMLQSFSDDHQRWLVVAKVYSGTVLES